MPPTLHCLSVCHIRFKEWQIGFAFHLTIKNNFFFWGGAGRVTLRKDQVVLQLLLSAMVHDAYIGPHRGTYYIAPDTIRTAGRFFHTPGLQHALVAFRRALAAHERSRVSRNVLSNYRVTWHAHLWWMSRKADPQLSNTTIFFFFF